MNRAFKSLKDKKGFTLVEIIVVMVILAVLAAVAIPSMIGFARDARSRALVTEARACLVAAQAIATEVDLIGDDSISIPRNGPGTSSIGTDFDAVLNKRFSQMLAPDITDLSRITQIEHSNGVVTKLVYVRKDVGSNGTRITVQPGVGSTVEPDTNNP